MPLVVTYVDIGLTSVEDYWVKLVVPNVKAFVGDPSPPTIFNAAHSLWHLHDWVWHERNPGQDTRNNAAFIAYRDDLLTACAELGWLRDIADTGKHCGLGRPNVEVAETKPRHIGGYWGPAYWGPSYWGSYWGQRQVYFVGLNDGSGHEFPTIMRAAVEFWRTVELADKSLPSPF